MAFETIRSAAGVDFIGTDGVDSLFSLNESGAITVDGKAGADSIILSDADAVIGTATIKGGAGNDTITLTEETGGNDSRLSSSSVNGGLGDDTINLVGAVSTVVRGNEEDDNFTLASNYTATTINGNTGEDSFTTGAGFALSNAKVMGGADNDGSMVFTTIVSAVDATINGSKGNDGITVGQVTLANDFTVFGGQGNDVITSTNRGSDSVIYSGDKGDDVITTGGAKDSVLGGEGNDLIATGGDNDTIDAGAGDDIVTDAAGDDTYTLGDGNDTYTDAGGDDTITGGLGRDIYTPGAGKNVYNIDAVAETAADLTGTTQNFDSFRVGFAAATDTIDISDISEALSGDANPTNVNLTGGGAPIAIDVATFAGLRADMAAGNRLTASGTVAGQIEVLAITITDTSGATTNIDGTYLIVSNTNNILDGGDLMFKVNVADVAEYGNFDADTATSSAWAI